MGAQSPVQSSMAACSHGADREGNEELDGMCVQNLGLKIAGKKEMTSEVNQRELQVAEVFLVES